LPDSARYGYTRAVCPLIFPVSGISGNYLADLGSLPWVVERAKVVQWLQKILEKLPDKKHGELHTYYKRMCRERQNLFLSLRPPGVLPDNNGSECAIRNVNPGSVGCDCDSENDANICVQDEKGSNVALICSDKKWIVVDDGPCNHGNS